MDQSTDNKVRQKERTGNLATSHKTSKQIYNGTNCEEGVYISTSLQDFGAGGIILRFYGNMNWATTEFVSFEESVAWNRCSKETLAWNRYNYNTCTQL